MPTVTPKGDITLSFGVKDRKATAAWFARHFGFELLFDAEPAGWCEMATNTPGVTLGFADSDEVSPRGGCVPVFGVADVDAARSALEAEGVGFDGDTQTIPGMVKLATFYDPDGNALMLAQDLSEQD